jgi:transposase InsO family protein
VAIDRTSKFAFARLHEKATRRVAADFLHALVEAVPYRVHTVLTDNGVQFTDTLPADEDPEAEAAIDAIWAARGEPRLYRVHAFDHACERHGIEHRLTKPYHPWTNGQVERMNRTLKDATVRRYHYGSHDELRTHLALFLDAYNHARRLKAIRGLTPYEFICQAWTREPERFRLNPLHHTPGLNT